LDPGLSYARANCEDLGIDPKWFESNHLHIHLPAGAVPKDGPSAGITMSTALISIITNNPIRKDIAMTGEVTLTGRVLPIGGIKEKSLAALSLGIKNVICPMANKKDVDEINEDIRKQINFQYVETLSEVLEIALKAKVQPLKKRKKKSQKTGNTPAVGAA